MGRLFEHTDWLTALLIALLGVYGLFLLLTISQAVFFQQLGFFLAGMVLLVLFSKIDRLILVWLAPVFYPISVLFLVMVFFHPSVRGAHRWFLIAGSQLQPSELVKPFLMLAYAWLIAKFPPRRKRYIPLHAGLFLIPFLLVFKEPDLGSSVVYAATWLAMMLAGGLDMKLVIVSVLAVLFITPWAWGHLAPYQQERIQTFLDPGVDPKGAGYNALQATIAVGSGQFFGKGLGLGTQSLLRFLPEYHTDFIFATLVEELGFIGGLLLFVTYGLLLWRLLFRLWRTTEELLPFVYGIGLFGMLLTQITINAGMNMGILPITGITLPFISYGGSSILSLTVSFAFLWVLMPHHTDDSSVAIT